jgi:hypothetical protein
MDKSFNNPPKFNLTGFISAFTPIDLKHDDSKDWILKWMRLSSGIAFVVPDTDTQKLVNLYRRKCNAFCTTVLLDDDSNYDDIMREYSLTPAVIQSMRLKNCMIIWVNMYPTSNQLNWNYCHHLIIHDYNLPKVMRLSRKARNFWELTKDICCIS